MLITRRQLIGGMTAIAAASALTPAGALVRTLSPADLSEPVPPDLRLGVFVLENCPNGHFLKAVVESYSAIDFPWHRTLPALRAAGRPTIQVRWEPLPEPTVGTWIPWTQTIRLRSGTWQHEAEQQRFFFAHECGHAVDTLTLNPALRAELRVLLHDDVNYRHAEPLDPALHSEHWREGGSYHLRLNEAFADLFVASFAPSLFARQYGSMEGRSFTHWTYNFAEAARLVLKEPIVAFPDVPADHPHAAGITWLADHGITVGDADGNFNPEDDVTRGQMATFLHRLYTNVIHAGG